MCNGSSSKRHAFIIGGGPAGLTAALMLAEAGIHTHTVEASDQVGGISRTASYKGFRFDIGGHRFFTKVREVELLWHRMMGQDFIKVPRMSRIYYDGKFYSYPLRIFNTLGNLGAFESLAIVLSYIKWRLFPHKREDNLEEWVTNRFGKRLFNRFFKTYTEKVWGIPCTSIQADWAAQRIQNLSLIKAVRNAVFGTNDTTSLIDEFDYPRLGPGMMWEKFRDRLCDMGSEVELNARVDTLHHENGSIHSVSLIQADGTTRRQNVTCVINTMPLARLVHSLDPPAPQDVIDSADGLKYRDFLIVTLIVDQADPFPDNWIYIHSPDVKVGRIQNFRSWSVEMVPDPDKASIGLEYFCHEGDGLWAADDNDLIELAKRELDILGLVNVSRIIDGTVIRQPKAYPVYDENYRSCVDRISRYIDSFENLQTVGRNGMHRYNNQDHSMLTAMLAAENIIDGKGKSRDVWNVNIERSYHEAPVTRKTAGTVIVDTAAATGYKEQSPEHAPHVLEIGSPSRTDQTDARDAGASANSSHHKHTKEVPGLNKEPITEG
jgi:protoporphyrinogen oxidase